MKLGQGSFGIVYKVYFQHTWHASINLFLIEMFVKINFHMTWIFMHQFFDCVTCISFGKVNFMQGMS
jgi:hypothetical protein